jgi:hypothetical protein
VAICQGTTRIYNKLNNFEVSNCEEIPWTGIYNVPAAGTGYRLKLSPNLPTVIIIVG